MPVTHSFVSSKVDSGDTSLVRPSDWNGNHDVDLTVFNLSGNTTLDDTHLNEIIFATAGAGGITLDLPTAVGRAGKRVSYRHLLFIFLVSRTKSSNSPCSSS